MDPHHNALMTGVKQVSWESNNNFVLDALKFDMKGLQKSLAGVTDPHSYRWRTDYYQSTIRAKNGPANMATLRNFALGVLHCNDIGNVKRCVENLRSSPQLLLQLAA